MRNVAMAECEALIHGVRASARSLGRVEGAMAGFAVTAAVVVALAAVLWSCDPEPQAPRNPGNATTR